MTSPSSTSAPQADDYLPYLRAAGALHRLPLDPEVAARVAEQFARTAAMAAPLMAKHLPDQLDPLPLYRADLI
jgi:hypothetical protein